MKKILYILMVSTLVLASCRRQEPPVPLPTEDLVVRATIDEPTLSKATASRGTAFVTGDKMGLWAVNWRGASTGVAGATQPLRPTGNYVDNVQFTFGTSDFTSAEDRITFPDPFTRLDLYAVSPYSATVEFDGTNYNTAVQLDQSIANGTAIRASDLMSARTTDAGVIPTSDAVALTFAHRLAKVSLQVVLPATYKGQALSGTPNVQITNTLPKASVSLINQLPDGVRPYGQVSVITPRRMDTDAGETQGAFDGTKAFVWEAIVVPQKMAAGTQLVTVTVTVGGTPKVFELYLASELDIVAGQHTILPLSLYEDYKITLGTIDIASWTTSSSNGQVSVATVMNEFSGLAKRDMVEPLIDKVVVTTNNQGDYTLKAVYQAAAPAKVTFKFDGTNDLEPARYPFTVTRVKYYKGATLVATRDYAKEVKERGAVALDKPAEVAEAANTYVIIPGGEVTFNATIAGNGSVFTGTVESSTTEAATLQNNLKNNIKDVRILWQTRQGHTNDADPMVLEDNGVVYDAASKTVTVTARTGGLGGNAVLAAYDAVTGGNILWSWHIWVSPVAESTFAKHNYGNAFVAANGAGKTIMDRNLGAIYSVTNPETVSMQFTGGMLYQWGRKDPFTGSADGTSDVYIQAYDKDGAALAGTLGGFTFDETKTAATILKSVQNPMTHYYNSLNNDWCNADERRRWQSRTGTGAALDFDNKGGKTLYDPCPVGYRVPTGSSNPFQGTWGDFGYIQTTNPYWQGVKTTAGSLFDKGTPSWYPASGLRYFNDGTLNLVASNGWYWSASPYDNANDSWYLRFNSSDVNPAYAANRSYGFPVRCVQE